MWIIRISWNGSLQSGQWLLQIPCSLTDFKSHLSSTDWYRELVHRDNESKVIGSSSCTSEPTSSGRVVGIQESWPLDPLQLQRLCVYGHWLPRRKMAGGGGEPVHSLQKAWVEHLTEQNNALQLSVVSKDNKAWSLPSGSSQSGGGIKEKGKQFPWGLD